MFSRNWEDWALLMPLALVPVVALSFGEARTPSFTTEAIAAEKNKAQYVMTVTAKRLPTECKGVAEKDLTAECLALIDGTTVTMRKND
jgi:hypothetical protein